MKRPAVIFVLLLCCVAASASDPPKRPKIFGIARVEVFASDVSSTREFYSKLIGATQPADCNWCERGPSSSFSVNGVQRVDVVPAPSPAPRNLLSEVTLATDNLPAMRRYLEFHKVEVRTLNSVPASLRIVDPEGHHIAFVQWVGNPYDATPGYSSRLQIIHAGFTVHDREAEDRFFKEILAFHLYWHGGMKDDGVDNWVSMQVPDGTDWIEYMLNVPDNADHHTLGVMNHFALGVADIHAAYDALAARNAHLTEQPKVGRDGKWQLNLYDPDDTRVEFMEFTPKEKSCCSPIVGTNPGPSHP